MSAEASGWVYRFSPLRGVAFTVHLALADSANDQHNYELWMRQRTLAVKARIARGTVNKILADMVTRGLLLLLEEGKTAGDPNRYRLLLPDGLEVVYETRGGVTTARTRGVTTDDTGVTTARTRGVTTDDTQQNPRGKTQGEPNKYLLDAFEIFYASYPRRVGKPAARKAWLQALRRVDGTDDPVDVIAAGLARANVVWDTWSTQRRAEFVPHPTTWLNQDRWMDEGAKPAKPPDRAAGPSTEVKL